MPLPKNCCSICLPLDIKDLLKEDARHFALGLFALGLFALGFLLEAFAFCFWAFKGELLKRG
jgi:hypothetical protein